MDTFSFWDATRLEQIQIDKNEDGKIERWEHYDATNKMVTVGTSSTDDGVEDTITFVPDAQNAVKIEYDINRDGVVDRREFWTAASADRRVLTGVEFDFDKSGAPKRRTTYRLDGSLDKEEILR